MSSGILLVIAGIWVTAQVFGGNALGRLGIVGEPDSAPAKAKSGLKDGKTGGGGGGGGGGSF